MTPATTSHPQEHTLQEHTQRLALELQQLFTPLQMSEVLRDLKTSIINSLREKKDTTEKQAKELEEAIKQITKL